MGKSNSKPPSIEQANDVTGEKKLNIYGRFVWTTEQIFGQRAYQEVGMVTFEKLLCGSAEVCKDEHELRTDIGVIERIA